MMMKEICNHYEGIQIFRGQTRFVVERKPNGSDSAAGMRITVEINPTAESWDEHDWRELIKEVADLHIKWDRIAEGIRAESAARRLERWEKGRGKR